MSLKCISNEGGVIQCYCDELKNDFIVLSYNNNVRSEKSNNYGITYLLDDILYNELSDYFGDTVELKSNTNYYFSYLSIECECNESKKVINRLSDFFSSFDVCSIDNNYIEELKDNQIESLKKSDFFDPINAVLYKETGKTRHLIPIKGTGKTIKDISCAKLEDIYRILYFNSQKYLCVFSNSAKKKDIHFNFLNKKNSGHTSKEIDNLIVPNTSISMNNKAVYYLPLNINESKDLLITEYLSEIIRMRIKKSGIKANTDVCSYLNPDKNFLAVILDTKKELKTEVIKKYSFLINNTLKKKISSEEFKISQRKVIDKAKLLRKIQTEIITEFIWNLYYDVKYDERFFYDEKYLYDVSLSDLNNMVKRYSSYFVI